MANTTQFSTRIGANRQIKWAGLGIPVKKRELGYFTPMQDTDLLKSSVQMILGTRIGDRVMNPEFGSRLKDLVFEPNDSVLKGLIRHYVIDAIERWEKRVYVTDVAFDDSPETVDANTIPVRISYRVIDTQVAGNLVWPFCRDELLDS